MSSRARSRSRRARIEASEEPLYDPEEIHGVIPQDTRKPDDVREIIARGVGGSRFDEFKARYGSTLGRRVSRALLAGRTRIDRS